MTQAEFRAAAPEGVEIVDMPPGELQEADCLIVHNVTQYALPDLEPHSSRPIAWYHHDLSPWISPAVREWLDRRAQHIFCSPMQRDRYGVEGACIPPALDLDAFKPPRQSRRKGTCSIGQWRNPGKGSQSLVEWAAEHGPVTVYGEGEFLPVGHNIEPGGPLPPDKVAQTLWEFERFVFLPHDPEPFCRCVVEAHTAGCEVITNRLVGATYWLTEEPEALRTAAEDFWGAVL